MACRCATKEIHAQRAEERQVTSHKATVAALEKKHAAELAALRVVTPDPTRYEIVDVLRVGRHLVLNVLFPNCKKCAFEGHKVLVYLDVTEAQALRWRRLDPHFRAGRDPNHILPPDPTEAPSPSARFPATENGWEDALRYAASKT